MKIPAESASIAEMNASQSIRDVWESEQMFSKSIR